MKQFDFYEKKYYVYNPFEIFGDIYRNIKWAWQRVFRGWDDRAAWSIGQYIFEIMPELLERLLDVKHGTPSWCFDSIGAEPSLPNYSYSENDEEKADEYFSFIVSMMIGGFRAGLKATTSDFDVYNEFHEWQIEKYGSVAEWDLDHKDSEYRKRYSEFDVYGKTEKEYKNLKIKLNIALDLFTKYHESLWD